MSSLGVTTSSLFTLGNLKYDTPNLVSKNNPDLLQILPKGKTIIVAGSTHEGEEQILLECYNKLRKTFPDLYLVIAPRNPSRSDQIQELAISYGLQPVFRSTNPDHHADILIVDTIGELVTLYNFCSIAFVGGSLVDAGGHNPIEPAVMEAPIIFGKHMEDFEEIAEDLVSSGGAIQVFNQEELFTALTKLLSTQDIQDGMGDKARRCVKKQQGVIDNHLEIIESMLSC